MKHVSPLLFGCLLAPLPLWGVYAPIPEQEQGKAWSVALTGGMAYDTNIFGAPTDAIGSAVESVAARVSFNASLNPQSFLSACYAPKLEYVERRPGQKALDSHDLSARLAHSFSPDSNIEFSDLFQRSRNPQSLLNGLPLNTDQSSTTNQVDLRGGLGLGGRSAATLKYRNLLYRYDNASLGKALDHAEALYGLSFSRSLSQTLQGVLEYRHQDIGYRHEGGVKDKRSDFALLGGDYKAGGRLSASARMGFEHRRRLGSGGEDAPSLEVSLKYDYARGSYVSGGYSYSIEESSDLERFNDGRTQRWFVNVQHALSARITASASLSYEPSTLQGRSGQRDIREGSVREGLALSWQPTKNWLASLTHDRDQVWSYYAFRELVRSRTGIMVTYRF